MKNLLAKKHSPDLPVFDDLGDTAILNRVLTTALERGGEYADAYIERRTTTYITLAQGRINVVRKGVRQGIGIRVMYGEQTGYAYSDDFDLKKIETAAKLAARIAADSKFYPFVQLRQQVSRKHFHVAIDPEKTEIKKKLAWIQSADESARAADSRIEEVNCTYAEEFKELVIANSDGVLQRDEQNLFSFHVLSLAVVESQRTTGYATGGGRYGTDFFKRRSPATIGREASEQAIRKLKAIDAPAGLHTVVIHRGWGGVLIHEAVGHGLEGDFNRRGTSVYSGRVGQKVASELVTIIDDGTIPFYRGSLNIDDEGTPTNRNVLIEKGVLKGYMTDRLNARLMKTVPSGNGRREDFTQIPMPRMTNTFIDRGDHDPEEIVRSVKKGIFAKSLGGGQVDITNGNFVFEIQEGYLIEDGKITAPIRSANLIGNGPDVMNKITAVGNDLEIETGTGTCGKDGQHIPVGVGQPTIKINEMTVGGTVR
ncbi:metalloprotease TldD [bacterium]|nr:metalloprotease TldD [bacterium]